MFLVYIAVAILALMFMITIHELGHYLAAKALKFRVTEFAIGFGKPIFKYTSKKTGEVFTIRMIPLGGFCAFEGQEDPIVGDKQRAECEKTEKPKLREDGTIPYDQQAPWKRLIVLFSGVFANFVCGVVFCLILLMSIGYYQTVRITGVESGTTPAPNANYLVLEEGDIITHVNGNKMSFLNGYSAQISKFGEGDVIELTIIRNGQEIKREVSRGEFVSSETGQTIKNSIGISGMIDYDKVGFFEGVPKSFVFAGELALLILNALGKMVTFQMSLSDMGGTFSTIAVMSSAVSANMLNLLILIPLISINLAVFNLLPIPALDGARMVFVTIEWIRGKPVNPDLENRIHMYGLLFLLGFVLLLDINFLIFQRLF